MSFNMRHELLIDVINQSHDNPIDFPRKLSEAFPGNERAHQSHQLPNPPQAISSPEPPVSTVRQVSADAEGLSLQHTRIVRQKTRCPSRDTPSI